MKMRKYLAAIVIIMLLASLIALSKSRPPQPNWTPDYYEMDNGVLASAVANYMFEFDYYNYTCCEWRPYQPNYGQLYEGDLWVCVTGGINKALYDGLPDLAWLPFGQWTSHISLAGDPTWPPDIPVMSDHDTYVGTSDQGYIGLEAYRHSLMWDSPADADYFIYIYTLKNVSGNTLNNLYIARFCDFDLMRPDVSYLSNVCGSDFTSRTLWMRDRQTNANCWVGMRQLNGNLNTVNHWDIYNDPVESQIISYIVNGYWFPETGANDWRILATYGPFSLAQGATMDFTVATAFGSSYADMMANLNRAKYRYDGAAVLVEPTTLGMIKGLYR
jgi:hypothetical protein